MALVEGPVSLDDLVLWETGQYLEGVNVLCVDTPEDSLVVELREEPVSEGRTQTAGIDLADEAVEGNRILDKVSSVEDGLGIGQVVLLKLCEDKAMYNCRAINGLFPPP